MRRLACICVLLLSVGCDDDGSPADGGGRDGGPRLDGSATDAGGRDGGGVDDDAGPGLPPAEGLPVGIPTPTFGWDFDAAAPSPTLWVDNTNPSCDDTQGTEAAPLCDLFRGGSTATFAAGTVVRILGGPYVVDGDYTMTFEGTVDSPVILLGEGDERIRFTGEGNRADFEYLGSYAVVQHLDFYHRTRHLLRGDHLVLRDVAVHNPAGSFIDFNPVVAANGHDLLIHQSAIFHNRRDNDTDSHGINAGAGSFNLWILENELYDNNGDSFQGCHRCFDEPPHHVYLGRNVLHEDRENAIDLKTIHDVVISENLMYGYGSSGTSSGDAVVIGSNGFDDAINQGPRRVWVLNNEVRESATGMRVEGSEDVWILGNVFDDLGTGLQIDNKPHRTIVVAANTMRTIATDGVSVFGCRPSELAILGNAFIGPGEHHLDMRDCPASTLTIANNLFWTAGAFSVRADGGRQTDTAGLNGQGFADANLSADPAFEMGSLVPASGSPLIDAGPDLSATYDAFATAFGPSIDEDRDGTRRGTSPDIGAYERP